MDELRSQARDVIDLLEDEHVRQVIAYARQLRDAERHGATGHSLETLLEESA